MWIQLAGLKGLVREREPGVKGLNSVRNYTVVLSSLGRSSKASLVTRAIGFAIRV